MVATTNVTIGIIVKIYHVYSDKSLIVDQIFRMSILTQFITLHVSWGMFIFKYRKVISIIFQQIQPAWQKYLVKRKVLNWRIYFWKGVFTQYWSWTRGHVCAKVFPFHFLCICSCASSSSLHKLITIHPTSWLPFILLFCCFLRFFIFHSRMDTFS